MNLAPDVSKYKLAARWFVTAILVVGLFLQSASEAIALASVAYFGIEGHRIQSVAGQRGTSISELVSSSGWLLRRGFIWALLAVVAVYGLLISAELTLTVIGVGFLYVAGVFSQAARTAEDEHWSGDERRGRPTEDEDEHRTEDEYWSDGDRQSSRIGSTSE